MTITVYGDDERAMWAEANADARDDAQWEFENLCEECGKTKPVDAPKCIAHMTGDEFDEWFTGELQVIA